MWFRKANHLEVQEKTDTFQLQLVRRCAAGPPDEADLKTSPHEFGFVIKSSLWWGQVCVCARPKERRLNEFHLRMCRNFSFDIVWSRQDFVLYRYNHYFIGMLNVNNICFVKLK